MNSFAEAMKGFTDIPIAIIALILGLIAAKNDRSKNCSVMMLLVSVASVLGAAVHIFALPSYAYKIIWIVLYPFLYESILRFTFIIISYLNRDYNPPVKLFRIVEVVLYLCSAFTTSELDRYDMLFFIAFCVFCLVIILICHIKAGKIRSYAVALTASLPVLVLLQAFSKYIPYAVVFEHIIICAILFVIYFMSIKD